MKTSSANLESGALARQIRRAAWSALALAATLIAAPAGAVTIDFFDTNQANVVTPGAPTVATGGADIIGTRRAMASNLLTGAGPVTTGVTGGALNFSVTATTPDSRGEAVLTWDGDSTAGNLNTTGLVPQNLRIGNHRAIRIRVNSASAGAELIFDVYSGAGSASRAALRLPAVAMPDNFELSYVHDFVPFLGTGANFNAVTALQMRVRGTEVAVALNLIDTIGPAVTATKHDLDLANAPIVAPVLEGSTIKYQVQISNSTGLAEGVDFTDTVDANTTLNAATVLATPVALNDTFLSLGNVDRSAAAPGVLANDLDPDSNGVAPELMIAAASTGAQATALGGSINLAANGSFTYAPPVGVANAVDTFDYTLQDNDGQTDTAQIRFVLGPRIWFVDDSHPGTNAGTSANPFVGFTGTNVNGSGGSGDQDGPGDIIFLYAGTHNAAIVLEAGQTLWGEGDALAVDGINVVAAGTRPLVASSASGVTLSTNNTLRGFNIGNTAATGFDIVGSAFGTLTVSNVDLSGTGGALSLANGNLAATFGSVATTSGPHGIDLNTTTGSLTISAATAISGIGSGGFGIRMQASGAATINLNGTTTITAPNGLSANGGTLQFTGTSNTISATAGPAVNLTAANLGSGATFSTVSSAGSATTGINLDTVTGNFIANGGSIATANGIDFDVNAGTSTITYAGTIANTASRSVEVTNRTGGTVTLSGSINDTGTGINLTSNSTGTIVFNGGLVAATTTNTAFNATGGGVINVCDEAGCNAAATGTLVNSLSTTTAAALNFTGTTIGASNLEFRSISVDGDDTLPTNAIVLSTTGSSGGLKVKGNGSGVTGGTIRDTAGDAILLTSTEALALNFMSITSNLGDGIGGSLVNGFELNQVSITANGNDAASDESGINLANLTGSAGTGARPTRITNSTVSNNFEFEIQIANTTGTLTDLIMSGNTISSDGFQPNHGNLVNFLVAGASTANMTLNITSGNFTGNTDTAGGRIVTATGVQCDHSGTGGTMTCNIGGASFTNNNVGPQASVAGGGRVVFDFNGNNIQGTRSHGVNVFADANPPFTKTIDGRIRDNIIGTLGTTGSASQLGFPIRVQNEGRIPVTLAITGNTVQESVSFTGINVNHGISLLAGTGATHVTITGNTIREIDSGRAVLVQSLDFLPAGGNAGTVCADISGNILSNIAGQAGDGTRIRIRRSDSSSPSVFNVRQAAATAAAIAAELDDANGFNNDMQISVGGTPTYNAGACTQPSN